MNKVLQGDCLEVLRDIPDNSIDSLVTDPPYGLSQHKPDEVAACLMAWCKGEVYQPKGSGFMGKTWDSWVPGPEIWKEVYRVLKPGAHALIFAGTRSVDLMGMAVRLAGFELRDMVVWSHGQGFPKNLDISKALDRAAGMEREVVGVKPGHENFMGRQNHPLNGGWDRPWAHDPNLVERYHSLTAPATPEAEQWSGWGTALKPAIEPILLCRKPLDGIVANNVLKHGVGGLNIEAARIGTAENEDGVCRARKTGTKDTVGNFGFHKAGASLHNPPGITGRYPANLVLSCGADCDGENHSPDCPVTVIDKQTEGTRASKPRGGGIVSTGSTAFFGSAKESQLLDGKHFNDTGNGKNASRFFKQLPFDPETTTSIYYQAKASKSDRTCGGKVPNTHPTVKSRHLIAYLLKLITPPGGIVLDCFGGSGTTAIAAIENNFNYLLIEREPEYIEIINQRIAATLGEDLGQVEENAVDGDRPSGQLSLF